MPKMFRGVPAGELIPPPIMTFTSSVISPTGLIRGSTGRSDPSGDSFSFTPHSDSFLTPPRTRTTVDACQVVRCFPSAASYSLATDPQCFSQTSSANPTRTITSQAFTTSLRGNKTSSDSLARRSLNLAFPLGTPRQICRIRTLGYLAHLTPGKSLCHPYEPPVKPTQVSRSMGPY